MRRLVFTYLSGGGLLALLKGEAIQENLPTDTRIHHFGYDGSRDGVVIVFESDTFVEVKEGDIIPFFNLLLRRR